MNYLIGTIIALLALLGFQYRELQIAKARNANIEVLSKIADIDKGINKNASKLEFERLNREQLNKVLSDAKAAPTDINTIVDFFRTR